MKKLSLLEVVDSPNKISKDNRREIGVHKRYVRNSFNKPSVYPTWGKVTDSAMAMAKLQKEIDQVYNNLKFLTKNRAKEIVIAQQKYADFVARFRGIASGSSEARDGNDFKKIAHETRHALLQLKDALRGDFGDEYF